MSPLLELGIHIPEGENTKFVRIEDTIAFDNGTRYTHKEIAERYNLLGEDGTVDDAGFIEPRGTELEFGFNSTTCKLSGDFEEARSKTKEIAQEAVGEKYKVNVNYIEL